MVDLKIRDGINRSTRASWGVVRILAVRDLSLTCARPSFRVGHAPRGFTASNLPLQVRLAAERPREVSIYEPVSLFNQRTGQFRYKVGHLKHLLAALVLASVAICASAQERSADDGLYYRKWIGCKAPPIKFDNSDRTNYMAATLKGKQVLLYSFDAGNFVDLPDERRTVGRKFFQQPGFG